MEASHLSPPPEGFGGGGIPPPTGGDILIEGVSSYARVSFKTDASNSTRGFVANERDSERDETPLALMNLFIEFFGAGTVIARPGLNRCDFNIQARRAIISKVIAHFDVYPLENKKQLDFEDFKLAIELDTPGRAVITAETQQISLPKKYSSSLSL